MLTIIIVAVIALAAGLAVGFLIARGKQGPLETRCSVLESQLNIEKENAAALLAQRERAAAEALAERDRNCERMLSQKDADCRRMLEEKDESYRQSLQTQEKHHHDALEAMQGRFDETIGKMQEQLKNETARLLKERQQEFETSSKKDIGSIVEPLQLTINQMKEAVNANTTRHSELGGQLSANIKNLLQQSEAARQSADRLASALRSGNKVQGDWGETVLTELLESQGLTEGRHFETQGYLRDAAGNVIRTDENRSMRPDVILHLDQTRDVIIDAKVSLSNYLDYINAETEEERQKALKLHVASLQKHVKELADKDYSSFVQPPKERMGYVIMFVPNTAALYAATAEDPSLWRKAMEKNVYIADEQTLYAALKIIDMTWTQIAQAQNHEKVFELADEMLKRVAAFADKFRKIGTSLKTATDAFEDADAKLKEKGQSIPVTCGKLLKLGASTKNIKGGGAALTALLPEE